MPSILDHVHDLNGTETHRLTTLFSPPEFVKAASHEQLCGPDDGLAQHLYADPGQRRFPCHTAPATWMSTLFFLDKRASIEEPRAAAISEKLAEAAKFFGIASEVGQLVARFTKTAGDAEAALPDDDFALVWSGEKEGERVRKYPLRNAAEVKAAEDWFNKYRDEFAYEDRRTIASKLLTKAAQHGVELAHGEMLTKTAGQGYCSADDLYALLRQRAGLAKRQYPQYSESLEKIAASVRDNPPGLRDQGTREKMASLVDQFDRATRLNQEYGNSLERPEEVIFRITEKAAQEFIDKHVTLMNGSIYEKAALEAIPLETISDWMGEEAASQIAPSGFHVDGEKLAALAATFPPDGADMVDQMAISAGVAPLARERAAAARGIPLEELRELRDSYVPASQLNGV